MAEQTLSLIVADAREPVRGKSGESSSLEVRGQRWDAFTARFNPRRADVKLKDVRDQLVRMEGEVAGLLDGLGNKQPQGFQLSEVEVSLALSASGSIGIATGGLEAAIALTFSRGAKGA